MAWKTSPSTPLTGPFRGGLPARGGDPAEPELAISAGLGGGIGAAACGSGLACAGGGAGIDMPAQGFVSTGGGGIGKP